MTTLADLSPEDQAALRREYGIGRPMGNALAHPTKAERLRVTRMKKTPLDNTPHRQQVKSEEAYYPAFEDLLLDHGCWFFHPTMSHYTRRHRGQKDYPDYTVFGDGWHAFVELKATSLATGRDGRLTPGQKDYKDIIERGGGKHYVFTLPADWPLIDQWLIAHTGMEQLRGAGR